MTKRAPQIVAALAVAGLIVAVCLRGSRIPSRGDGEARLRIVSLAPSVTEMLFVLGVEDCMVGRTDRCDYPPAARRIRSVGGFGTPSVETLLALSPDLVIATGLERPEATEALRRAGIRILWIKTGCFEDLFDAFRKIGREVGAAARAEQVVARMQAQLKAVGAGYRDVPREQRPRVFVEVWNDPLTTVGSASFVDELVERAGGVNVAHGVAEAYPTINPEKVVEWNPEVIVLSYMSQQQASAALAKRIGWDRIRAVRSGRIISDIPSDLLLRPGPRLVDGVRALNQELYANRDAS